MDTKPHHIKKRLAALLLALCLAAGCLPAALAADLSVDAGFYFKQSRGGTCTLASAAMMLRRRAYMDGLDNWVTVTENTVRSSAWSGGLVHSFTYNEMQVGYATLPSGTAAKTQTLIQLLEQHPEGIVLYDRTEPHAVLLTDYTDGQFYCSDPAGSVMDGRIPLSQSLVSLADASCYWYILSDHNDLSATQGDGLRFEGMSYPHNIQCGKGMSLTGVACSASGTTIAEVEIAILDAMGQTVQSASAAPGVSTWSFQELDSAIRFGELTAGTYTYMVMLTDSTGQSICFASDFTVTGEVPNTDCYWSVQDTSGTKLVQQTEESLQQAVTDTAAAVDSAEQQVAEAISWLGGLLAGE